MSIDVALVLLLKQTDKAFAEAIANAQVLEQGKQQATTENKDKLKSWCI